MPSSYAFESENLQRVSEGNRGVCKFLFNQPIDLSRILL